MNHCRFMYIIEYLNKNSEVFKGKKAAYFA